MTRVGLKAMFLFLTIAGSYAAAANEHEHHMPTYAPCADREAPATLSCALAASGTFDTKGRLWMAWAFGGHVYVNSSDDQGRTFSQPIPVNLIPERVAADGENRPKIVIGPKGEIYVSWTERREKLYSGDIRFARSLDGGQRFSDPLTVNDNRDVTSHRFDSLAVNKHGEIYIAWLDKRDMLAAQKDGKKYAGAALYFALSTDQGRSFHPNRKISDHTCECCRTAMTLDASGLPIIAWRQIYGENTRDHALVRFKAPDTPATPIRLSHDKWQVDACPHHGPAVAAAGSAIHAVWFDNATARHGLFYSRSMDGGTTFETPVSFGNYDHNASHPYVAATGNDVYLAWMEFDGDSTQAYVMASHDGGQDWSTPRAMAATAGRADHPLLIGDGKQVYLSWLTTNEGYRLWPLNSVQ